MNKLKVVLTVLLTFTLVACEEKPPVEQEPLTYEVTQTTNPICSIETAEYTGDEITLQTITTDDSDMFGDKAKFLDTCKTKDSNPIVFANGKLKTYSFEVSFDAIYPIDHLVITNFLEDDSIAIKDVDISISLDGEAFTKIEDDLELSNTGNKETSIYLSNQLAKYIKVTFKSEVGTGNYGSDFFGLNDIRAFLGEGYIVKEATEWDEALTRYEGWTGADGIFSFNLENGNDSINTPSSSTLFIFSDTILGNVNPDTFLRTNPKFLNNTIGYFNGDTSDIFNNMTFEWLEEDALPANIFEPDYYVGYHPSNLGSMIGLTQSVDFDYNYNYEISGSSWKSSETDQSPSITLDFLETTDITSLDIYNFVEDITLSTTSIHVAYSNNNVDFTDIGTFILDVPSVSTSLLPVTISTGDISATYIKIELLDNNTDTVNQVGLSKVLAYNDDTLLYSRVTASSYDDTDQEVMSHPRLWLQDGVVIGEYFYTFPLLVKDYETFFKVYKVGLIKVPIVNDELDLTNIEYFDTPLQHEMHDGSIMYFGAGVNNMDTSGGLSNQDGYIYVYGYKDNDQGRLLTVARVEEEHFENFNKWTYFDGENWSSDINDAATMINSVSPELSVTYMTSGLHQGKYMLVVMENTTSGIISVSYSDTPYGPWTDLETVYLASAIRELPGGFAYNAKMHPHLSDEGKYLISYNVNTTGFTVMSNAEIYHPRFVWLIETKQR